MGTDWLSIGLFNRVATKPIDHFICFQDIMCYSNVTEGYSTGLLPGVGASTRSVGSWSSRYFIGRETFI